MNLLPQASGTRPRLACEISPQGVVAARADAATAPLAAVARVTLAAGAVIPSLKPGNIPDRVAVVAGLRRALENLGQKAGTRGAEMTLVIPDAAVRVLLLDFDALPNKLSEALPIVRFRLKKLLPFDADDAMISYQVMSTSKTMVRVLAVAMPRDVLAEYETAAREAGFEPGAVLPSTLACVAVLGETEGASLIVNATEAGVTTAIVRGGILLLHRSVDLQPALTAGTPANFPAALFEDADGQALPGALPLTLPLVDTHESASEWAAQEALPEHGRSPYADALASEAAVQDEGGVTEFAAPIVVGETTQFLEPAANTSTEAEIAEAVNVAAAYFEDTLLEPPTQVFSAGPMGAEALQQILAQAGVAAADGLRVRELVLPDALAAGVASVPRCWLAGVAGALRG